MKKTLTISFITAFFILMSIPVTYSAISHRLARAKTPREIAEGQISRNITCPQFLAENTGTNIVRAMIEIDEKGKISVDEISSSNDRVSDYVVEQLKGMTIKNIVNPEKFVLLVRFVVD